MAILARALGRADDASEFEKKASGVREAFNHVFFDSTRGLYVDGEGSRHASLHANLFAIAFGLAPKERASKVADFLQSKGMACSVYGAQYLLEALFAAGRDDYAVSLICARTQRSWWHMIESGSTMTWEAWDAQFKKNLTWNHAWGAAPANLLSRYVLGVRPLEPGYRKILIAPQPGRLQWIRGKVPTAVGTVQVDVINAPVFRLTLDLPSGGKTTAVVPARKAGEVLLDGTPAPVSARESGFSVEVPSGRHVIESR